MGESQTRWVVAAGTKNIAPGYCWEKLTADYGAAIWLYAGTVSGGGSAEERVCFTANTVTTTGGAVQVRNGAILDLTSVDFSGNSAGTNGGAVYSEGNVTLRDAVFSGNTAAAGGAVRSMKSGSLTISGTTFSGNSAGEGGAIWTNGTITLADVVFDGNSAGNNGGAVYGLGGETAETYAKIRLAGKIVLLTVSDTLKGYHTNIIIDSAAFGTGAYYQVIDAYDAANWNSLAVTVEGGNYTKQTIGSDLYIKRDGADFTTAIFSADASVTEVEIAGQTFTGVGYVYADTAVAAAFGADNLVYAGGGTLTFSQHTTVAGGKNSAVKDAAFRNITSGAVNNSGYLTLENVVFADNSTTGAYGGAVYSAGGTISLADVTFDNNTAATNGGAMALYNTKVFLKGKVTLAQTTDVIFSMGSNSFTIDGAAFGDGAYYQVIDAVSAGQWTPAGSADVTGGYTKQTIGSDLYIKRDGADFTTAIFSADASVTEAEIAGQTFTGVGYVYADTAVATAFGANNLVYAGGGTLTFSQRTTVAGGKNSAVKDAAFRNITSGAVNNSGYLTLENVVFADNSTTGAYGGAIYSVGGTISLADVTFDNNTAATNGGAMALYNTKVFLKGKVTLAQATDVIFSMGSNSFTIDGAAFGDGAYYQVIDAVSAGQWTPAGSSDVTGGYTKQTIGSDLYIKRDGADFTTAIFSADASVTEAEIAGQTFTGVGYVYADTAVAAAFNAVNYVYDGFAAPVSERVQVKSGTGYYVCDGEFRNSGSASNGGAVYDAGAAAFDGTLFSGNTTSADGGAIYALRSASLTVAGSTFTGNAAASGGAIMTYGDLTLADVVFDGNHAAVTGGAVYCVGGETAETFAALTLKGKVTLVTESDTLKGYHTNLIIDSAAFGPGDYYQVIDACDAAAWNSFKNMVKVTGNYSSAVAGTDLYIKNNDIDFSTAILTEEGTAASLVVAGRTFTGYAFTNDESVLAGGLGAVNFAFDGFTAGGDAKISSGTVNTDSVTALKNSHIDENLYAFDNNSLVNGDVTMLLDNTSVGKAVYAAGSAAVAGDIMLKLTGSTIGGNLAPTSSAAAQNIGKITAEVINSRVNGTVRGTGSGAEITVGSVEVILTDSYAGSIVGLYGSSNPHFGNKVTGPVDITLAGSTVNGNISRKNSNYTTEFTSTVNLTVTGGKITTVAGSILGMDTVTVAQGAELRLTGGTILEAALLVNDGTITVTADNQLTLQNGAKPGTINVDNCTLTVNVNGVNTGLSYEDVNLLNSGTLTVTGTGFGIGNRIYNYCVVDSTLSGKTGDVVTVKVDGVDTQAIFGVNAFTDSAAAQEAHAGSQLVVVKENITGNYYGNGALKINDTVIGGNLYGQGETIITGGTIGKVAYGGKLVKASEDAGDSSLTITGGTFAALAVGGSRVSVAGTSAAVTGGTTALNISGGSFASHLIAAGYVINTGDAGTASLNMAEADLALANITTDKYAVGGAFVNNGSATVGTVNVAVTSGTYKSVFGGGWAQKGTSAVTTANITVSGGSIHNLYAGGTDNGTGNAATVGTANITISGGSVRNIFLNGKYSRDTVTAATLNITGNCELNWIEGLSHSMMGTGAGTTLNIKSSFTVEDILHVKTWNFDFGKEVTFANGHTADLNGTAEETLQSVLNFNVGTAETGEDGWAALTASAIEGLVKETVLVNGIGATAFENNVWRFDGTAAADYQVEYKQYDETGKALVVSKLG